MAEAEKIDGVKMAKGAGIGLWKIVAWAAPLILLGWLGWTMFFTGKPGQEDRAEEFLRSYQNFVQPYQNSVDRPVTLDDLHLWLDFFDADSRSYFESNFTRIVRRAKSGDLSTLGKDEKLSEMQKLDQLRLEAARYAINVPPLNGEFRVNKQETLKNGDVEVLMSVGRGTRKVIIRKELGRWRIVDFAGAKSGMVPMREAQ